VPAKLCDLVERQGIGPCSVPVVIEDWFDRFETGPAGVVGLRRREPMGVHEGDPRSPPGPDDPITSPEVMAVNEVDAGGHASPAPTQAQAPRLQLARLAGICVGKDESEASAFMAAPVDLSLDVRNGGEVMTLAPERLAGDGGAAVVTRAVRVDVVRCRRHGSCYWRATVCATGSRCVPVQPLSEEAEQRQAPLGSGRTLH
jgi:hypothetical protein